jgi:hypothetical protein
VLVGDGGGVGYAGCESVEFERYADMRKSNANEASCTGVGE